MPASAKKKRSVAGKISSVVVPQQLLHESEMVSINESGSKDKMTLTEFYMSHRVHRSGKLSRYNIAIKRSASGAPACVLSLHHTSYAYTRRDVLPPLF